MLLVHASYFIRKEIFFIIMTVSFRFNNWWTVWWVSWKLVWTSHYYINSNHVIFKILIAVTTKLLSSGIWRRYSGRYLPTFRRKVLSSSLSWNLSQIVPLRHKVNFCILITRHQTTEYISLQSHSFTVYSTVNSAKLTVGCDTSATRY